MDDIVKAALKKWPNVPNCYRWLGLDARGDWYLRDGPTQAAGTFPQSKGHRIVHDKLKEFIGRNYEHDDHGAWFFQNGPQRVYVDLEVAPWVWGMRRRSAPGEALDVELTGHTGVPAQTVRGCWVDEAGRLFLETELGLGVVRSLDMEVAADAIEAGLWTPEETSFAELVSRFGFALQPEPAQAPAAPPPAAAQQA